MQKWIITLFAAVLLVPAATLGKQSVKDAMLKHGFMAKSSTPEALTTYLREQLGIWKAAGVEAQ